MITYLQNLGSKITDFTSTSVVYQIFCAIASVIDQLSFSITTAQNQATVTTATGSGLDNKGADLGVPRKQATAAVWNFTFHKNVSSANTYTIPAGTVITTISAAGQSPITFATNTTVTLAAGTLLVQVLATCQQVGSTGNIAAATQLLIGSGVPGIDGVSLDSLTGGTYGADVESDDDYRARLLAAPASKAQGTIAWYLSTAESVTGVQSATVNPDGRGAGTVDVYIVGTGNAIPSSSLISSVQATIDAGRIITDDAKVFAPTATTITETITVKVASTYTPSNVATAVQTALVNYINNLGIGGGSAGVLYQSQLIAQALAVPGVLNAITAATDVTFTTFQLPQASNASITISASY